MVERRALILFFPMAFLLSWYPYILGKTHLVKTSGGINPLGPMVAALIVAAICYGKAGVIELLGRYVQWDREAILTSLKGAKVNQSQVTPVCIQEELEAWLIIGWSSPIYNTLYICSSGNS